VVPIMGLPGTGFKTQHDRSGAAGCAERLPVYLITACCGPPETRYLLLMC
jgi:hypothetical protein